MKYCILASVLVAVCSADIFNTLKYVPDYSGNNPYRGRYTGFYPDYRGGYN